MIPDGALFKILIIGDSKIGKSCLVHQYCHDSFDQNIEPTLKVDLHIKTVNSGGKAVKLQLQDAPGSMAYLSSIASYAKVAHAILVCFDPCRSETFRNLDRWWELAVAHAQAECYVVLVALRSQSRLVCECSEPDIQAVACHWGVKYHSVSARTGEGVAELFHEVLCNIKACTVSSMNLAASTGDAQSSKPSAACVPASRTKKLLWYFVTLCCPGRKRRKSREDAKDELLLDEV